MYKKAFAAITALATVLALADATAGVPTSAPQTAHRYTTWTQSEARSRSPFVGTADARRAAPGTRLAAEIAFTNRVQSALPQIESDLGLTFSSAAIDATAGNVLVVRTTGSAGAIRSGALAALDGAGAAVRIVEHQAARAQLLNAVSGLTALVGTKLADSTVIQVSRDDMSGLVIVGVDRDAPAAQAMLAAREPLAVVIEVPRPRVADGGSWGNSAARYATPVAGGESIVIPTASGNAGCTSTLTVTRYGSPAVVTAGHCLAHATAQVSLGHDTGTAFVATTTIGSSLQSYAFDTSGFDAGVVANGTGSARSCIVKSSGACPGVTFAGGLVVQGAAIGASGATTGDTSGNVQSADTSVTLAGDTGSETIPHSIQTSNCIRPGDSGSPLYRTNANGSVNPIGIVVGASCPSYGASGYSAYSTNWNLVCGQLHLDAAYCPTLVSADLSATMTGDGIARVFWRGSDNNLWNAQGAAAGALGAPLNHGFGPLASAPSVGTDSSGHTYAYWKGTNGDLFEAYWDGTVWQGPFDRGMGVMGSGPTVAISSSGYAYVFWKGGDGALWQALGAANGALGGPYRLGYAVGSAPSAGVDSAGATYVYWKGGDGALWEAYWTGTRWSAAISRGMAVMGSAPSTTVTPGGEAYVFWKGGDGTLWEAQGAANAALGGPYRRNMGTLGSAPTATLYGVATYVYWLGTDTALWRGNWSGTAWVGPTRLGLGD